MHWVNRKSGFEILLSEPFPGRLAGLNSIGLDEIKSFVTKQTIMFLNIGAVFLVIAIGFGSKLDQDYTDVLVARCRARCLKKVRVKNTSQYVDIFIGTIYIYTIFF